MVGVLEVDSITMNTLGAVIIIFLLIEIKIFNQIDYLNKIMMFLCMIEYLVLTTNSFLTDFWHKYEDYSEYILYDKDSLNDSSENPL